MMGLPQSEVGVRGRFLPFTWQNLVVYTIGHMTMYLPFPKKIYDSYFDPFIALKIFKEVYRNT